MGGVREGVGASERLEGTLVAVAVAHSCGVGLFLALLPAVAAAFGGFGVARPEFFVRQAGVFHLVLAAGYLAEYLRSRGVALLVLAKGSAVVFLAATALLARGLPWSVPLSAALDGLLGLAVALSHRAAARERAERIALDEEESGGRRAARAGQAVSDTTG
jgi:hypothetical protein